jgi:hypothetical protein
MTGLSSSLQNPSTRIMIRRDAHLKKEKKREGRKEKREREERKKGRKTEKSNEWVF